MKIIKKLLNVCGYSKCPRCQNYRFVKFNVLLGHDICQACEKKHIVYISQSQARKRFGLREKDLKGLKFRSVTNPVNRKWQKMKQFLEHEVFDVYVEKIKRNL